MLNFYSWALQCLLIILWRFSHFSIASPLCSAKFLITFMNPRLMVIFLNGIWTDEIARVPTAPSFIDSHLLLFKLADKHIYLHSGLRMQIIPDFRPYGQHSVCENFLSATWATLETPSKRRLVCCCGIYVAHNYISTLRQRRAKWRKRKLAKFHSISMPLIKVQIKFYQRADGERQQLKAACLRLNIFSRKQPLGRMVIFARATELIA